jgi:hypothetical protein
VQDLHQKLIELQHKEKAAKEETEIYKKQLYQVVLSYHEYTKAAKELKPVIFFFLRYVDYVECRGLCRPRGLFYPFLVLGLAA